MATSKLPAASKVPSLGGYDCDFVDEPPDSLKCLICMLVVKEPWQHGECGRVYCRICIEEYAKTKNTCPNCRQKKPSLFRDGRSEKDVRALMVRCSNCEAEDSCDWTGELGDLERHCSNCPLESLPCPNKCNRVMISRRSLQEHLKEECSNRPYTCPHCKQEGAYSELQTSHTNECMKIPIRCPNAPCAMVVTRATLREHNRSECPYATTTCCHSDIGCSAKLRRVELKEHEADMESHLETAKFMTIALKKEIANLKESMAQMELKAKKEVASAVERAHMLVHGQKMFKITEFSMYKSRNKEFKSQPFYTGQRGYKMCVIVEANGVPKVKGSYVSVYAHLMCGEHDDCLPWPLVGTVTFELLNQLGNHNHRKRSCTFPPDDKDNRRVLIQEIADAGYGCPKFISHAKLGLGGSAHDVTKDVQYLKDDTIYLRVAVEAPDTLDHDWLKCY